MERSRQPHQSRADAQEALTGQRLPWGLSAHGMSTWGSYIIYSASTSPSVKWGENLFPHLWLHHTALKNK